jgi:hypothetical protein
MLDERGISWAKSWPGEKLHKTLLEAAKGGDAKPEPKKEDAPKQGAAKKGESGKDKLKKLLVEASELVGWDKVQATMEEIAGTVRIDGLNKETGPKVAKAVQQLIDEAKSGDGEDW